MIPEIGHFSLILALGMSMALVVVPGLGVRRNQLALMNLGQPISLGLFLLVLVSFLCLEYAFVHDDFSVAYVAHNSNSHLPIQYKISALWGAHEGSMLLWVLIMSGWTAAVGYYSRELTSAMRARVLTVMATLSVGFILFVLYTSNPFLRNLPVSPNEGGDLNPLLQDFGLIVHPPILYMGYVGFSVPFAFAIATLMSGQLDSAWARWSRPWTNLAWGFLTLGITLGSWWAYYELGWGGWWFWDAVENASFMPWLVGTALVHSLAVTEKRGVYKSWTVLLAIFAFSLSLLGAFLVRSGVLTSVHAFAIDPQRGLFILAFLVLVIGSSLTLYAVRVGGLREMQQRTAIGFNGASRESLILINNVLLVVAASAVLLGTLYPLIFEAMTGGRKISVGPPYFNTVFVPICLMLAVAMALSPVSRWKRTDLRLYISGNRIPLIGSAVLAIASNIMVARFEPVMLISVLVSSWILIGVVMDVARRVRNKVDKLRGMLSQPPAYYGMVLAHLGIAVAITGVAVTSVTSEERDVRMVAGDVVELAGYEFKLVRLVRVEGPNYDADRGVFEVSRVGQASHIVMLPEKRRYRASANTMTEAAIDGGLFRDLFVALGEPIDDKGAWAVRIHHKPFVRWIWFGGLLIALGAFLTIVDPRYRRLKLPGKVLHDGQFAVTGS